MLLALAVALKDTHSKALIQGAPPTYTHTHTRAWLTYIGKQSRRNFPKLSLHNVKSNSKSESVCVVEKAKVPLSNFHA